jgi:putative intracellular protease/amidase
MQRTVHVAVYDTLADWEYGHAVARIRNPAWQREPGRYHVATVAETAGPVTTMGGIRIVPDLVLADLRPQDSALLLLPGADTWEVEGGNAAFAGKAREFLAAGVPVAAICGATAGLAREGLLDDRDHTSAAPEYLAATGYGGADRYRDEPAVTDGGLITASPTAPVEFAREVLALLDVYSPEVLDAWYQLFGRQDASAFGALAAAEAAQPAARA